MLCYRYENNIFPWRVYYWFMTTFMPKNNNGLLSIFFAQIRAIWNNWSSVTKNHNIYNFSNSVFITELEFFGQKSISVKNVKVENSLLSNLIDNEVFEF